VFALGADDGDVAGVVAGCFFLLIGVFVFLVDDDEAERFDRGEDGGAGADDDSGAALADLVPFVVAFAGGEVAMEDGDEGAEGAAAEPGFKTFDGLGGEGDFGDEDDGAAAELEAVGDGLEIDLGFPAAGDAVEHEGLRWMGVALGWWCGVSGGLGGCGGIDCGGDGLKCGGLLRVEGKWSGR